MKCLNCNKEFENKSTKPAKYCSDKCRMAYNRRASEQTNGASEQITGEQTNKTANEHYMLEQANIAHEQPINLTIDNLSDVLEKTAAYTPCQEAQSEQAISDIGSKTVILPDNFGLNNCACMHCKQLKTIKPNARLNHFAPMSAEQLKLNGYDVNRVSLPGDSDYTPREAC